MHSTRIGRGALVATVAVAAAIGILMATMVVPAPRAAAASGPSAVIGDWSVPERLVDANGDGYIDYYLDCRAWAPGGTLTRTDNCRTNEINPTSYLVTVDACASEPGEAAITRYEFRVGGQPAYDGHGCSPTLSVPAQGDHLVDLTIFDADGNSASTSRTVTVRDLLVVSIGDSYGSGEGVPPFIDQHPEGLDMKSSRCDRSSRAASAQAALKLEKADPRTSVTFIHLACSGAQIVEGVVNPYKGQNPTGSDVIPPQLDYLKALIGDRPIDLMHMSIGGNDMGFADIITACIDPSFALAMLVMPFDPVAGAALMAAWLAYPNCDVAWNDPTEIGGRSGGKVFEEGIAALPERYEQLHRALQTTLIEPGLLSPERIYLTEYPDFTRDHLGDWCGWSVTNPLSTSDLPGFTKTEFQWASEVVAPSLTAVMKAAVQSYRWNFVGGISSQYARHGYCAGIVFIDDTANGGDFYPEPQHWIVGISESISDRGSPTSAFHPNIKGQNAARDRIYASWSADLRNPRVPPSIKVIPTLLGFTINTAGSNGWSTGECAIWDRSKCNRNRIAYTVQIKGGHAVKGPLEDHVRLAIDGKPVRFVNGSSECHAADGDSCAVFVDNPAGPNLGGVTLVLAFDRPGAHVLDISADNVIGLTAHHRFDFKVDLTPPTIDPLTVTSGTKGSNDWYLTPVGLELTAADAPGGSGVMTIETLLPGQGENGTPARLETSGDPATGPVSATLTKDGNHLVSSEAVDFAGLRSGDALTRTPSGPRYDRVKIDQTAPTLAITGIADGTSSWSAGEVADGPVFTNSGSVQISYVAADATSGVREVRVGSVSSGAATGTLTVPVPAGLSTQLLEAEDVAGHTVTVPFTVLRTDAPAAAAPEASGFWKNAVSNGTYAADDFAGLLSWSNQVSHAFGVPTTWYPDVTPSTAGSVLQPAPASETNMKVRRDLLAAWLNLVSGRLGAGQQIDLRSVKGWNSVVTNTGGSSKTTALNLAREAERRLTPATSDATLVVVQTLLDRLNTGRLNA